MIDDQNSRVDLRRPRRTTLTGQHVKLAVLLVVFVALVAILVDMGLSFSASLRDGTANRTFLTEGSGPTAATTAEPSASVTAVTTVPGGGYLTTSYFVTTTYPPRLRAVQQAIPTPADLREHVGRLVDALQGPPPVEGLRSPLPEGTKLLAVFRKDADCYVDLSLEVARKHTGNTLDCLMTVQALVNTVTRVDGIERVKILVGGKERLTLAGHFDLLEFWRFDGSLVDEGQHAGQR